MQLVKTRKTELVVKVRKRNLVLNQKKLLAQKVKLNVLNQKKLLAQKVKKVHLTLTSLIAMEIINLLVVKQVKRKDVVKKKLQQHLSNRYNLTS